MYAFLFAADDWVRLVPARNAMVGILQTKLKAHKIIAHSQIIVTKPHVL